MDCKKCGFENPEGMRFCGKCAFPLNVACPSCGFENPFEFEYCGQCATGLASTNKTSIGKTTSDPVQHTSQTENKTSSQAYQSSILGKDTFMPKPSTTKSKGAERRQLTVLFCDMVGSSALSERIDPEELRDIMSDYRSTCSEIIARYDGHIAQYLGDGILVYFGFPHAHEDDAQRATYAALELVKRIPQHSYSIQSGDQIRLGIRVGIHTGLVVVGEIGGGDKRSMALGETPNIAARIQDHAAQNTVVVSERTCELLGDRFDIESLGDHPLKGFSQPIELFAINKVRAQKDRLPGHQLHSKLKLIGREQETDLLYERLNQAQKGVGQIVLLTGEPGLGKTRMAEMICDMATDEQCIILECCGAPYYKNSFLYPVVELVRRITGLGEITDTDEQLSCIEKAIATLGMNTETVTPILAELLSIPIPHEQGEPAEKTAFTPHQKKLQTMDTLVELLKRLAQQRFVFLVVEDLQWVDHSTIEFLSQLVNQPGLTNIFALFTFRDDFAASWKARANLTQITLNRLTQKQSGSLIRQLCQGKTLPVEVFSEIINKTDGIPFFVQELTNTVLRSSLLIEKENHFELSSSMERLGIPATLKDSLMSRLDNLGEDKELAQLSSTLGREFTHDLLSAAAMQDAHSLQSSINRLINADLFSQRGKPPRAYYRFQHALLREAAYHSLLKKTRQKYHQRVARLIKEKFPNISADNPEILAHHCTNAGDHNDALNYWLSAGRYAIQRSANIEAAAHLNNGLDILTNISNTDQSNLHELALQTTLGLAVMMSKGYAAPEVENAYARAHHLCKNISDENTVFPILCGLWEFYIVRSDLNKASKLANELQTMAAKSDMQAFVQEAQRALGTTQFWKGEFSEALINLQLPIDTDAGYRASPSTLVSYCQDARVASHANAGCVLWLLGQPKQAMEHGQHALHLAKTLAHPFSQAYALNFLGTLSQLCGDHTLTYQYADAQIALSETYGFSFWTATGRMLKAWAESPTQPPEITCKIFQQALTDYENSGNRLARPYFQSVLIGLLQDSGQLTLAQQIIETALLETSHNGEVFFTAELLRLQGELYLAQRPADHTAAESLFIQAFEHAKHQQSNALALRAITSLTKLLSTKTTNHNIAGVFQISLQDATKQLETLLNQFSDDIRTADTDAAAQLLAASRNHSPSKTSTDHISH